MGKSDVKSPGLTWKWHWILFSWKCPGTRLRHWCSSRYLRISLLHREFQSPLQPSSGVVSNAISELSSEISHPTYPTTYAPFTPSDSEQRLHPPSYRGCWHGVGRCFLRRYRHISRLFTARSFVPPDRALRPEGLHHPRGVAASEFPPLRIIPDCCIP